MNACNHSVGLLLNTLRNHFKSLLLGQKQDKDVARNYQRDGKYSVKNLVLGF